MNRSALAVAETGLPQHDEDLRVLLVEDSPVDTILVEAMLAEAHGMAFGCKRASTLAQARSALAESTPTCVMVDLGLPDSDGLATLDRMLEAAPDVAIVVLTGLDDERVGQAAIVRGAQDYLVKGKIDAELLSRSLDYAIARKRSSLTLRESETRYRALVETAPDAIVVHSAGTIAYVNPTWVRLAGGTQAEEFIGRSMRDFLSPTETASASLGADTRRVQAPLMRLDRTTVEVEVVSTMVTWRGRPALQTILRDLSAQRQAEWALRESEARYRMLNAELDKRVRERTAELEQANMELEAFAYSVSHDLRAPLRSIDGFSQALLEDCADQLDTGGQDSLRRIRAAAQRMAQLIDDLLKLSRLTRADLHVTQVDLSELAASVSQELRASEPRRQSTIRIADGLVASGDPVLLRTVLENLLGNAWKFSAPKPATLIEVGSASIAGETAYYVRDNGVGFNLAYADKLFGPFQRLHSQSEFPGTGIGLASVRRIVRRHGGRIWAEAQPGQGATLWFSLGTSSEED
jgi:PAS domain S-box-containing protein